MSPGASHFEGHLCRGILNGGWFKNQWMIHLPTQYCQIRNQCKENTPHRWCSQRQIVRSKKYHIWLCKFCPRRNYYLLIWSYSKKLWQRIQYYLSIWKKIIKWNWSKMCQVMLVCNFILAHLEKKKEQQMAVDGLKREVQLLRWSCNKDLTKG